MFYADFVRETSTAPGTATFDLDGAAAGYQGFVAAGADGETVYYAASDGTDWEVGTGTVTDAATDTLTRTVIASSNSNAAVNFAGEVTVDLVFSAQAANKTNFPKRAVISDTKSSGTDGGTFTSGAWQTRDINTEDADPDGIVSIASNQFTLQAGTYFIRASAPSYKAQRNRIRLQNITNGVTEALGATAYSGGTAGATQPISYLVARFVIGASTVFEIQHMGEISQSTIGFGVASGFGVDEIYTTVEIEQLA